MERIMLIFLGILLLFFLLNYCFRPVFFSYVLVVKKKEIDIPCHFSDWPAFSHGSKRLWRITFKLNGKIVELNLPKAIYDNIQIGDNLSVSYRVGRVFRDYFCVCIH